MNVVITGGTGLIGRQLVGALRARGDSPIVFTRDPRRAAEVLGDGVACVEWDSVQASGPWEQTLADADALVNLAGQPVETQRWDESYKRLLRTSRIDGTRSLVEAMARSSRRPRVMLNASATHYYGRTDGPVTEEGRAGNGFVPWMMQDWEREAMRATAAGTRVVCLRIGWVLVDRGGGLEQQFPLFRAYLGGPLGGSQWVPWIHVDDMVGLALRAIDDPAIVGAMNCVAPTPVRMRDFAREVGRVLHRPSWLPIPPPLVRAMVGGVAEIILDGANARPGVASRVGYEFQHPELLGALTSLTHRAGS